MAWPLFFHTAVLACPSCNALQEFLGLLAASARTKSPVQSTLTLHTANQEIRPAPQIKKRGPGAWDARRPHNPTNNSGLQVRPKFWAHASSTMSIITTVSATSHSMGSIHDGNGNPHPQKPFLRPVQAICLGKILCLPHSATMLPSRWESCLPYPPRPAFRLSCRVMLALAKPPRLQFQLTSGIYPA